MVTREFLGHPLAGWQKLGMEGLLQPDPAALGGDQIHQAQEVERRRRLAGVDELLDEVRDDQRTFTLLLCADKAMPDLYFLYVVDFDAKPIRATRKRYQAKEGEKPKIEVDGDSFRIAAGE